MNEEAKSKKTQSKSVKKVSLKVRLLAAVLSPVVFICILELVLRLVGYGIPSEFFVPWTKDAQTLYLPNKQFCEHFVPKSLSRSPEPSVLLPKADDTYRIFVLGGSAANGDPDPTLGFCRQLEIILNEHSDKTQFEVINAAVTSMNSHVARRIARDCARHEPDLFIVYMGNNEVVGPYGPPTLPEALYKHGSVIDLSVALKKDWRVGQGLKHLFQSVANKGQSEEAWLGMEAFLGSHLLQTDPKLSYCYQYFKDNLADIAQIASECGAKTFFCTVPTNLADCPPFASQHKPALSKTDLQAWEAAFEAGRALQVKKDYAGALVAFDKAYAIDDTYADLAYCIGQCYLSQNQMEQAKIYLLKARDLDTLRFRADTAINQAVKEQSEALAKQNVELLDLVTALEMANQGRPIGQSVLVDHVHLNMPGNYILARTAAEAIRVWCPELGIVTSNTTDAELLAFCQKRLMYDAQAQYDQAMVMYQRKIRPPFAGQLDHDQEMFGMRNRLYQLKSQANQAGDRENAFQGLLKEASDDPIVVRQYAEYLVLTKQIDDAIKKLEATLKAFPYDNLVRNDLARLYAGKGGHDKAMALLMSDDYLYPCSEEEALQTLGSFYVKQGRYLIAFKVYTRLKEIAPHLETGLINLASAASYQGDQAKATQLLNDALKINPQSASAMINLGNYHAKREQPLEALAWFERAAQADPYNYIAEFSMGMQKLKLGKIRDGMKHVTQSVHMKPDFVEGYKTLVQVYTEFDKTESVQKYAALQDLFSH